MKNASITFLAFFLFLHLCSIYAEEIIFIPGWFTENSKKDVYESRLREIYPNQKVSVLTWPSNTIVWKNAVENADAFA